MKQLNRFFGLAILLFVFASGCTIAPVESLPHGQIAYDVRAFGAIGDGKALDSPAINRAIEAASAAGGGTVFSRREPIAAFRFA